jgi:hypothetical protein
MLRLAPTSRARNAQCYVAEDPRRLESNAKPLLSGSRAHFFTHFFSCSDPYIVPSGSTATPSGALSSGMK